MGRTGVCYAIYHSGLGSHITSMLADVMGKNLLIHILCLTIPELPIKT
jgi:hypothetical protein